MSVLSRYMEGHSCFYLNIRTMLLLRKRFLHFVFQIVKNILNLCTNTEVFGWKVKTNSEVGLMVEQQRSPTMEEIWDPAWQSAWRWEERGCRRLQWAGWVRARGLREAEHGLGDKTGVHMGHESLKGSMAKKSLRTFDLEHQVMVCSLVFKTDSTNIQLLS